MHMHVSHILHNMHSMQSGAEQPRKLMTARQVQDVLHIDRSTVYRMAEDGRIPAIKVGKQWRFPSEEILALISDAGAPTDSHRVPSLTSVEPDRQSDLDPVVAAAVVEATAELLGVMMVVTDMTGQPVTPVTNPCPWLIATGDDPDVIATCLREWRDLADDHDLTPRFRLGEAGFECARSFIRSGSQLTGMVLAGGVSPAGDPALDLFTLDQAARLRVLQALPRIATAISRQAPRTLGAPTEEKK